MFASVHADRSGRVFVSEDHSAAGLGGSEAQAIAESIALPAGVQLVPLEREAVALGRNGRPRPLGAGRLAVGALLPPGYARLLAPAYRDDLAAADLDPAAFCAVGADDRGDLILAARDLGLPHDDAPAEAPREAGALRQHPANALARQLARCARDHACRAARAGLGGGALPVPLGAPPAERPRLPVALRSGYAGAPTERAAFRPTADEIVAIALDHAERGGTSVSFGRACDGEPLAAVRVLEAAAARIRAVAPACAIHVETSGSDPAAMRRAIDAGVGSVTVRIGSALAETYERLHGPVAHRWADVRASLQTAAARGVRLTVAVLVLPGLTDRPAELGALVALLGELPGGRLELRDLGADPLRALAAFPRARARGVGALLDGFAEADHFRLRPLTEVAV